MNKNVNLTVRLDENFKARAQVACQYMCYSMSGIVYQALRKVIDEYEDQFTKDTNFARLHCRGQIAEAAYDLLSQYAELQNGKGANIKVSEQAEKLLWEMVDE